MNSKLRYIAGHHHLKNVTWLNTTKENGAWVYIGVGDVLDYDLILRTTNQHLGEQSIQLIHDRGDSVELEKSKVKTAISALLGIDDFQLWNIEFTHVVDFNKTGVMRVGILR